ncbi:MAG: hypothetical protein KIT84_20275 [Labilithrix sp.]|nr:hypothetical protein [Labilithrix sp.]MCW5813377.1 hypothetical protein [Labilithrix sp.]
MSRRQIQLVMIGGTPLERGLLASEISSSMGCGVVSIADGETFEFSDASQADFDQKYTDVFKSGEHGVGIVLRV